MAKYNVEFEYFHDYESEQFAFYRIPKVLFTDDYFHDLSCDAKVLYGLMLDRMALSIKNKWIDQDNRVYIIFSLEQVMKYMNCGRDKGMKILAELDTKKGIGLIERVKQGFGKPDIIYVKSFVMKKKQEYFKPEIEGSEPQFDEAGTADLSWSEKPTYHGRKNRPNVVEKTDLPWSEKPTCRGRECRSTVVEKTDPNDTYYNNTDLIDNEMNNINRINPSSEERKRQADRMDGIDIINAYTAIVKENIDYGWDWVLQEKLTEYGKEHQIYAKNAVVLAYIGYDIQSDRHSFYLQLDDKDGTILLGTYHPYQVEIEETDKTLEDIKKEKKLLGDEGEPDGQSQENNLVGVETPEPTKPPTNPYAEVEILEVPMGLAELLGENAHNLPEGLAIFLAAEGREGDTYAVYSGNLNIEDGKAQFDLELKDGTVVNVDYNGEYRYCFE